jgi:hypothetical protein
MIIAGSSLVITHVQQRDTVLKSVTRDNLEMLFFLVKLAL